MSPAWHRFLPPDLPAERVAAAFGLISDTHMPERCAELPPSLFTTLADVDMLLHAGDVGELWVLDRLSAIAPVIAVHGNDESLDAQNELPYQQVIAVAGQRLLLTHAHYPDRGEELASRRGDDWEPKLRKRSRMSRSAGAAIVVFGHTHIPLAHRHDGVLLINPGALASGSFITRQTVQTVAILFLRDDGHPSVIHVDLASPDQLYTPRIDWPAGFAAALDQFSQSILAPEVEAIWPNLRTLGRDAPDALHYALVRAAHRCWSGDQAVMTKSDLLAELQSDATIPASVREQFEALLS